MGLSLWLLRTVYYIIGKESSSYQKMGGFIVNLPMLKGIFVGQICSSDNRLRSDVGSGMNVLRSVYVFPFLPCV